MDSNTVSAFDPKDVKEFQRLKDKIKQADLPEDLAEDLNIQLERLQKIVSSSGYKMEFEREMDYIDFASSLPFHKSSHDVLDLKRAADILNRNHYGLDSVKQRILEYLAILILKSKQTQNFRAPILMFVGLVGSGKTSMAYSIGEALGRKVIRIPFGGLGSVKELRGESRVKPESEPSFLMKSLTNLQVNNPVILLDEIDRVATEARHDVMGVLVELLDPEQNFAYVDHYVDYPFDLSKAIFVATANNTGNIATAVLDRMELIEMPAYSDEEKITIGRDYLLPRASDDAGVRRGVVNIDQAVWPQIVRPLGYDAGIRSLQRTIQTITRKIARKIVEGNPGPFHLTMENIGEYLQ